MPHRSPSSRTLSCDLCGQVDFERISDRDRRRRALATVICRVCGLVSHEEIPGDGQLDDYYRRQYRQDYHGEHLPSARRVVREWHRGQRLQRLLAPHLNPDDHVFEIGSGIGCTVKNFELAGFEASGIEPNEGFCHYSARRLGVRVRCATLAELPSEPTFDLILLVHVLEHLNRPRAALQHLLSLLKPGGQLYIEVPNLAAPHAAPGKLFHFAHIYNFTPTTLWMLATHCGFTLHRDLTPAGSRNLMMLFERGGADVLEVDPHSYESTLASLDRYNRLTYTLRWSYLRDRAVRLFGQVRERLTAPYQLRQILSQCQSPPPQLDVPPVPARRAA